MDGSIFKAPASPPQSKWVREYDLRWSKGLFLLFYLFLLKNLWDACRYIPDTTDKIGLLLCVLVPVSMGVEIWKLEKRGEMTKERARSFLFYLAVIAILVTKTLALIVHNGRIAEAATQHLK